MGEKRAIARFADWFARKEQAENEGSPFAEPPPFLSANRSAHNHNPQP